MRAPLDAASVTILPGATDGAPLPLPAARFDGVDGFAFSDALARTRSTEDASPAAGAIPLAQLLKLILILQLLGAKVPQGMINMLRDYGLGSFADAMEARNLRIETTEQEDRASLRRAQELAVSHTAAA